MASWEQQPGEPTLWFARLERFRLAGPGRSLLKLYNEERERKGQKRADSPPTAWRDAAKTWNWRERADAWDAVELAKERERRETELAKEREQAREHRRTLLKAMGSRVAQGLTTLDPKTMKPADVIRGVQAYLTESRAEYDEEPTQRVEHSGPGGGPILVREIVVEHPTPDEPLDD